MIPFHLPNNLYERSLSTKVQYITLFVLKVFFEILVVYTGVSILLQAVFTQEIIYSLKEAMILSAGITLLLLGFIMWNIHRKIKKTTQVMSELNALAKQIKEEFEKQSRTDYLNGRSKKLKRIVDITIPQFEKAFAIGFEFSPLPNKTEDETLAEVIDATFKNMVVNASTKSQTVASSEVSGSETPSDANKKLESLFDAIRKSAEKTNDEE